MLSRIIFSSVILLIPLHIHAAEIINSISTDTVFSIEESPYIIMGKILVSENVKLTVHPGVEIIFKDNSAIDVQGAVDVKGLKGSEVIFRPENKGDDWQITIQGLAQISYTKMQDCISCLNISGAKVNINNLSVVNARRDGLSIDSSEVSISSSTIESIRLGDAISVYNNSKISIHGIQVGGIGYGAAVGVYDSDVRIKDSLFDGGLDTAIEVYESPGAASSLSIHNSAIKNFEGNDIYNAAAHSVDATKNWWPRSDDPSLYGEVLIEPRLTKNPFSDGRTSILFLPGFQASRLYQSRGRENQLWEPNRADDVRRLFLDEQGQPIEGDIYTKDVLSEVNILGNGQNIYKSFLSTLDDMVSSGSIFAWKSYPYDWRFDVFDVLQVSGDWLSDIRHLADHSGSVTIVAHSNGGLLAKAILSVLKEKEKDDPSLKGIIERAIFVATPHFGTPAALAGLLFGEGQSILSGIILSKSLAVEFGKNLLGAYGLLPSERFFSSAKSIISGLFTIDSFAALKSFLVAVPNGASYLNESLFSKTENSHLLIDDISQISTSTKLYQIVGSGLITLSGIHYFNGEICEKDTFLSPCKNSGNIRHRFVTTKEGDGTVLTESAGVHNIPTFEVGIDTYNDDAFINRAHADILEIPSVISLVKALVKDDLDLAASLPNISQKKGERSKKKNYKVGVHSPVSIDVYDKAGRHVGVSTSTPSNSDIKKVDLQIPNSSYWEVDGGKEVFLGGNSNYLVELNGTGVGTFTLEIETHEDDEIVETSVFQDIPVTHMTQAHLEIKEDISNLFVDIESDGIDDVEVKPGNKMDFDLYVYNLKRVVDSLCGIDENRKKKLHSTLDIISEHTKDLTDKEKWNFILVGGDSDHMSSYSLEKANEFARAIEALGELVKK